MIRKNEEVRVYKYTDLFALENFVRFKHGIQQRGRNEGLERVMSVCDAMFSAHFEQIRSFHS